MVKIIGAGFARTGTTSLKAALERLGFGPCYHMFEIMSHPDHLDRWRHVASDQPTDWSYVFDGYRATLDWPASCFWREQAETYPEAKIILTVRDPHRWYASIRDTFLDGMSADPEQSELPEPMRAALEPLQPLLGKWIGEDIFGGHFPPDETHAVEVFRRHVADVQRELPADRLLVYEVGQGWQPLCDFLGVEPPADEPFPHLNDKQTMQNMMQRASTEGHLTTPFDHAG